MCFSRTRNSPGRVWWSLAGSSVVPAARDDRREDRLVALERDEALEPEVHVDPSLAGREVPGRGAGVGHGAVHRAHPPAVGRLPVRLVVDDLLLARELDDREAVDVLVPVHLRVVERVLPLVRVGDPAERQVARLARRVEPHALELDLRVVHQDVLLRHEHAARRPPEGAGEGVDLLVEPEVEALDHSLHDERRLALEIVHRDLRSALVREVPGGVAVAVRARLRGRVRARAVVTVPLAVRTPHLEAAFVLFALRAQRRAAVHRRAVDEVQAVVVRQRPRHVRRVRRRGELLVVGIESGVLPAHEAAGGPERHPGEGAARTSLPGSSTSSAAGV